MIEGGAVGTDGPATSFEPGMDYRDRWELKDYLIGQTLERRIRLFQIGLILLLLGFMLNFWYLQGVQGEEYAHLAENNRLRKLSIEAPRGLIRDRHGRPLVENVPRYSLLIDRSRSRDLEASVGFAAEILERPASELRGILAGHRQTPSFKPVQLAGELSLQQVARFGVEHL